MTAELWGINAPVFVKSELLNYWIPYDDDLDADSVTNYFYGAFGYGGNEWGARGLQTIAEASAGIMELTYCGVPKTDPRIIAAQGFINKDWLTNYGGPGGWQCNLYSNREITHHIPLQIRQTGKDGTQRSSKARRARAGV